MIASKEKNFVSAVIYVHDQQKGIYKFLQEIHKVFLDNFENFEIICVNDFSLDESIREIRRFSEDVPDAGINILNMSFYQGLELSMNAGVDLAIGDFVYEFDSPSLTYSVDLVMDLYFQSIKGYDIVSATPNHKQKSMSDVFYAVFNRYANLQYPLKTETFRILSRRAINRVQSMSIDIPYRKAIYANCGLKMASLPYENTVHLPEKDKISKRKEKEVAVDAIILYTDLAYKCSITFSCLMMGLILFMSIYTLGIYIGGKPVAGWTTTMMFLSCAFLGIFIILTIIIKYISVILKYIFMKQKYVIESLEKVNK